MGIIRPIDPEKLNWFRNRELNSFDWIKSLSEEELDRRIDLVVPKPKFTLPLFKEQKVMFLIGTDQPTFIFWAGIGVGKTTVALNLIRWRYEKNRPALALVLDTQNAYNWLPECKKFAPELKVLVIDGTKQQRLKKLQKKADLYVMSYDGLQSVLSTGGRTIKINPADVRAFARRFKTLIFDEMVTVKNPKSITFQVCRVLSEEIPYKYGLTGRPFGRVALDLWAQFYVIDGGETLGRNMEIFKQSFFTPKKTPFAVIWKADPAYKVRFSEVVKNKAIYFPEVKLPPPVEVVISLDLPEETKVYYRKLKEELIATLSEDDWRLKIRNPFVKFRQVCSGYLLIPNEEIDEDTGEKIILPSTELTFANPKEKLLQQVIEALPEKKKLVIFYSYTPSGKRIVARLNELKVRHVWLWGQTKDKAEVLNQFNNDPKCRILVANIDSGSTGLNLQIANYEFFYEDADNIKDQAQAMGRCWRRGQEQQVYIYHALVKGTVEERIRKFLAEGQQLFEEIVMGKISDSYFKTDAASFLGSLKSRKDVLDAFGGMIK